MKVTKVELTEEQNLGLQTTCTKALPGVNQSTPISTELLDRAIAVCENAVDDAYSVLESYKAYTHRPYYVTNQLEVCYEAKSVLELLQELKGKEAHV